MPILPMYKWLCDGMNRCPVRTFKRLKSSLRNQLATHGVGEEIAVLCSLLFRSWKEGSKWALTENNKGQAIHT